MDNNQHLAWIQKNHTRKEAVQCVSSVVTRLAGRILESNLKSVLSVARALADVVDAGFRKHCRIESITKGCLVINVDDRNHVYPLRMRWHRTLLRELPVVCRSVPVGRIVFRFGTEGQPIQHNGTAAQGPQTGAQQGR